MTKDTNKYLNWVLTINETREEKWLPTESELVYFFEKYCESYVFQLEKGEESERMHYQCALRFKTRKRKDTVLRLSSNFWKDKAFALQWDRMRGTWAEALNYSIKTETRIGMPVSNLPLYDKADIAFLEDVSRRYPWQVDLLEKLFVPDCLRFKTPDDRKITWITDTEGNSGKSKFTKYLCLLARGTAKVAFGTASQMRASIIAGGPQFCYIVDIPRTLGRDDDMHAVLSLLEDLKNGFVVSSMYGKNQQLVMAPPHVVVFTNLEYPKEKLSADRWDVYFIKEKELARERSYYWPSSIYD